MTKGDYVSNVYIGKHEKHKYHVSVWKQNNQAVELHVVYGTEALKELLSGCYDWQVNDITTGECNITVPNLTKGIDMYEMDYDED